MNKIRLFFFGLLFPAFLPSCASVPTDPQALAVYKENNDPLEPFNRKIFSFNMRTEKYILRPIANGYRDVTTEGFRRGARSFFSNLGTPITLVNDILQLNIKNAGYSLSRFTINSTLGFFGIFDVADRMGIQPHSESFANTLGVYGMPAGPYLMLPFLGPSNARDLTGFSADLVLDPLTYASAYHNRKTLTAFFLSLDVLEVMARYENSMDLLDDARQNSLDFYAYSRSLYRQYRRAAIENAAGRKDSEQKASYEFSIEDDEE